MRVYECTRVHSRASTHQCSKNVQLWKSIVTPFEIEFMLRSFKELQTKKLFVRFLFVLIGSNALKCCQKYIFSLNVAFLLKFYDMVCFYFK